MKTQVAAHVYHAKENHPDLKIRELAAKVIAHNVAMKDWAAAAGAHISASSCYDLFTKDSTRPATYRKWADALDVYIAQKEAEKEAAALKERLAAMNEPLAPGTGRFFPPAPPSLSPALVDRKVIVSLLEILIRVVSEGHEAELNNLLLPAE